jgi:hypothetical protein
MKKLLSRKNFYRAIIPICMGIFLTYSATQSASYINDVPGFWMGILHGFASPFALIGNIFTDIRIYASPNSGWFYNLGFIIGISLLFSEEFNLSKA